MVKFTEKHCIKFFDNTVLNNSCFYETNVRFVCKNEKFVSKVCNFRNYIKTANYGKNSSCTETLETRICMSFCNRPATISIFLFHFRFFKLGRFLFGDPEFPDEMNVFVQLK